jgi:hypothetical protein
MLNDEGNMYNLAYILHASARPNKHAVMQERGAHRRVRGPREDPACRSWDDHLRILRIRNLSVDCECEERSEEHGARGHGSFNRPAGT